MKTFKKLFPYIIALVIGIVVMLIVAPSAKSQRLPLDPIAAQAPGAGIGGEVLIPVIAVGGVFFFRCIRKDAHDGIWAQLRNFEEDDQ